MPITNQTLENELDNVANSQEKAHIRKLWDNADSLMQEISVNLIQGNNIYHHQHYIDIQQYQHQYNQ